MSDRPSHIPPASAYPHPVVRATDAPAPTPAPAATDRTLTHPFPLLPPARVRAYEHIHLCLLLPIDDRAVAIMQRKGDGVAPNKSRELDCKCSAHTLRPRPRPTRDLPRQERTPVAPSVQALDTRADYALPPCPARLAHRTLLPPSYPPTQARAAQLLPSLSTRSPTPCGPARLSRTDEPRVHRSTQHVCVFLHPRPRRRHYVESLGRALRSAPIYPLRLLRLVAAAAPYTRAPRHAPR
ncbi:hypothetical protein K438DRAFT_1986842 [Mycena galopus ATCC 62051]|nr:hypothetical protein K438DRAFT_1986842 [Mycena galopus ATCC 62051]